MGVNFRKYDTHFVLSLELSLQWSILEGQNVWTKLQDWQNFTETVLKMNTAIIVQSFYKQFLLNFARPKRWWFAAGHNHCPVNRQNGRAKLRSLSVNKSLFTTLTLMRQIEPHSSILGEKRKNKEKSAKKGDWIIRRKYLILRIGEQ